MNQKKKPGLLITGVGGALASALINRLKYQYDIIGVGFKERSHRDESITYYRLDFSKRGFEEVFRNHKIKSVIHLGRILLYEYNRLRRYNVNVLGTQQLLDLSAKYKVEKMSVLSTFYVYGAHPYNPTLLDEMFPLKASHNSSNLADSVELEYLTTIYMLKHPELNITILRPCNIVGPGVQNSVSLLLQRKNAPYIIGFSPIMQFIHVDDLADAIRLAHENPKPGIYNVVTDDYVPYKKALELAGVNPTPVPSVPSALTRQIVRMMNIKEFPDYLLDYYKYPVVLNGTLFKTTFGFKPLYSLTDIFDYFRSIKE